MDCKTARLLMLFGRTVGAELDSAEAESLGHHLADCAECRQMSQAERNIDAHLGRAIRSLPMPDGLRDRLLARLGEERRLAYRRQWVRSAVAVAAAILVTVVGWLFLRPAPAQIDLAMWSEEVNNPPKTAGEVEEAFRKQGLTVRAPVEFNYSLLTHYGQAQLQGRLAPYLVLRGTAFLRVYLLDADRFDLAFLERNPEAPSGRVTVKWWGKSPDGKFGYVIEHTTDANIEMFKTRDMLPAA